MSNFIVYEGDKCSLYNLLDNEIVKVGDTISYITNNQEGKRKYKVILNLNGEKDLRILGNNIENYEPDSYNNELNLFENK